MYCKTVSFQDAEHAYHIPEFVQLACNYKSHITVRCNHAEYNAKSIMGMMSLDLRNGQLKITAEGEDEAAAVNALASFISGE